MYLESNIGHSKYPTILPQLNISPAKGLSFIKDLGDTKVSHLP